MPKVPKGERRPADGCEEGLKLNTKLAALIAAVSMLIANCSGINPAEDRADAIAASMANCEQMGKEMQLLAVEQASDGNGGIYTTVRSRCVDPKPSAPLPGAKA
jgi:hypothetical protein